MKESYKMLQIIKTLKVYVLSGSGSRGNDLCCYYKPETLGYFPFLSVSHL